MKQGRLEWAMIPGAVFGVLVLAGFCWIIYRSVTGFINTSAWIVDTHEQIQRLSTIRTQIIDVETGSRGYVLTGRDEYLTMYDAGISRIPHLLQELQLFASDGQEQRRLAILSKLADERIELAKRIVEVRTSQGFEAARALIDQGEGKRLTDEIRLFVEEMESAERQALAEGAASARFGARRMIQALALIALLAATLLILSAFLIRRDVGHRRCAERELRESREALQDFLDNANDMFQSVSPEGRLLYVNRKWVEALGFSSEEAATMTLRQVILPEKWDAVQAVREEVLKGRTVENYETVFVAKNGRQIVVSGNINVRMQNGVPVATRGIFRDITETKRAATEMEESNEILLRSVRELEQRSREIADLGEMGDLLQSCQTMEEAYKIIARSVESIFRTESGGLGIISSSRSVVEIVTDWGTRDAGERVFEPEDCWALRRGKMSIVEDAESALRCPHAGFSCPRYACVPLVAQGEALGLLHLRGAHHDVSLSGREQLLRTLADRIALAIANLRLRDILRQQSVRDPLTGLFNRRYMEESLEREIRRSVRNGRPLGILMLDLDHFKRFNDTYGHTAGDALLREFGTLLGSSIRAGDIACRYGGEEFSVILPDAPLGITRRRAEQLRDKARHLLIQHRGVSLGTMTVSIGVSSFPEHGSTAETLLRAADAALYQAKRAGRDRVEVTESRTS